MLRILVLLILMVCGFHSSAQISDGNDVHKRIDSLRIYLAETPFVKAEQMCLEFKSQLETNQDTISYCWGGFLFSSKLAKTGSTDLAFSELERIKPIALQCSDSIIQAGYWQSMAVALYFHFEQIHQKDGKIPETSVLHDSIRAYNTRALTPLVKKSDPLLYTRGLIFQAITHRWYEDLGKAQDFINEADEIAREYGLKHYNITILNIRAAILNDMERFDEALMLYEYGIEEARKDGDDLALEAIAFNYGDVLFNLERDAEAVEMYKLSYDLSLKSEASTDDIFTGAQRIKDCYYFLGDFENAFKWSEISNKHQKEIETSELRLRFEKMQIETANLENERMALKHAEERFKAEEEVDKQQRNILVISAVAIILLLSLGSLFILGRSKAKNKALQHEKEVSELIRRQEISSMEAMMSGQEGERKRLGRELHDHIGSMLSTIGMHFSSAFEKATGKEISEIDEAKRVMELLDNTVNETRKLSHDMMTGVLSKFGLVSALRDLCDQISETGKVNVLLNAVGMDSRLEAMQELNLYRISQELVSNALKHASPQTIRINLIRKKETIILQVKDDGIGMTQHQFQNGNGAGFSNITGRVTALHGKIEFGAQEEAGTLIRIIVPLKTENNAL